MPTPDDQPATAAAWVCPLCQDKGMVPVTFADGTQEIVPCSAQCVRKAGLDAD